MVQTSCIVQNSKANEYSVAKTPVKFTWYLLARKCLHRRTSKLEWP